MSQIREDTGKKQRELDTLEHKESASGFTEV